MKSYSITILIIFLSLSACSQITEPNKNGPDLVIDTITYEKLSNVTYDDYGKPLVISGKYLEFSFTIKNIGNQDYSNNIYISNTTSSKTIYENYYPQTKLLNLNGEIIPVNEKVIFKSRIIFNENVDEVKFKLNNLTQNSLETNEDNNDYYIKLN